MFNNSPFNTFKPVVIPDDIDVIFVADMYVENYVGGAELTTEALINSSPLKVHKIKSSDLTLELLESAHRKHWIFGNFAGINQDLIPTIVANMNYSVLEYDFKYCKYRSSHKHIFQSSFFPSFHASVILKLYFD